MPDPDDDDFEDGRGSNFTFETTDEPITLTLDTPNSNRVFEVNTEKRMIFGLAVPFGEPTHSDGAKFQFSKGVIQMPTDPGHVKLLISHQRERAVGRCVHLEEREDGLWARFSVARGPAGDEALSMAEDGVWDGLSIGLRDGAKFSKKGGVTHFSRAVLSEISLTPDPAFSSARVAAVVAEASTRKEPTMGDQNTEGTQEVVPPTGFDMEAFLNALAERWPGPTSVVDPTAPTGFEADESPYAFEAGQFQAGGDHEFSTDIFAAGRGDRDAHDRAMQFIQSQFAVAQTNVTSLNPTKGRPDMYVDQRDYRYPLWDAVKKGTLSDNIPFVFPKFNSATGLVADHTEGVEPTPGAFTATSQTVTPKAMSGKVEITREVYDAGGNPQVSNLIWAKMVRSWNEALEASVVTELNAQAANITDIPLTTAGANSALVGELTAALADLQYQRGGFRFDTFAAQIDLYKKLVAANDTTGRPLLPIYGVQNSNGTTRQLARSLDVGGVETIPSWALAASGTVVANSWLFDSESVHGWASTPQRLDFNFGASIQGTAPNQQLAQVAFVTLAIWGYRAVAVSDYAGVRQVTYDPI